MRIEESTDEAVVTRRKGMAPGTELVAAVRRTGYNASVIPLHLLEFDCPDMDCDGCPEKVKGALGRARGVRAVSFSSRTHVVVFYDRRQTRPDAIRLVVERQGLGCATNR